jgi:hypothetical protein
MLCPRFLALFPIFLPIECILPGILLWCRDSQEFCKWILQTHSSNEYYTLTVKLYYFTAYTLVVQINITHQQFELLLHFHN